MHFDSTVITDTNSKRAVTYCNCDIFMLAILRETFAITVHSDFISHSYPFGVGVFFLIFAHPVY
jgi:hypothetical protein